MVVMDKLFKKVNEVIKKYNLEERKVDEEFFYELFFAMASFYKFSGYVNNITFFTSQYCGYYKNRNVNITIDRIANKWRRISGDFSIPNSEKNIGELFYFAEVFFHELEHAFQEKIMTEKPYSLSGKILVEASSFNKGVNNPQTREYLIKNNPEEYRIMMKRVSDTYKDNYFMAPQEKLAEIKANAICFKSSVIDNLQISDYFLGEIYKNFLRGYDEEEEPTKAYISLINPFFDFNEVEKMTSGLSGNDRCMFGLKVSDYKLIQLESVRDKILSKIQK